MSRATRGAAVAAAVCWDERFATHDMGRGGLYLPVDGVIEDDVFIDNSARIVRTRNLLAASGVDRQVRIVAPRAATRDELLLVHSDEHIERASRGDSGDPYTPMGAESYELALLSAGSALTALT